MMRRLRPSKERSENHGYTPLEPGGCDPVDKLGGASFQFNISRSVHAQHRARPTDIRRPTSRVGSCWQKFRWGKWVIKPNPSRNCPHWIVLWDTLIATLVLVTSFYVPMQASLGLRSPVFDYLCDVAFVGDMIMQFFVAQPAMGGGVINSHGLWITDPCQLAELYLRGPFWPDLISIMPVFVFGSANHDARKRQGKDISAFMRGLSICRLVRLARLARIIQRWQASSGVPFFYIELVKFFVVICFSIHWIGCAWAMVVRKEAIETFTGYVPLEKTWLSALVEAKGDPCIGGMEHNPMCVYVLSVYWAAMTLTTVGYGDITPQNLVEYLVCALIMIISGIVWAYVVGSIVSMVANSEPLEVEFKQRMDELNVMMNKHGITMDLQVRLRRYMHEAKHFHRLQGHRVLLRSFISPGLQREIAKASAKAPLLSSVFWIADLDQEPYHELVKCLNPMFFGPLEAIHAPEAMIVVHSGIIAVRGQILSRGDVWGHETVLLESYALSEDRPPATLSYVDVLRLDRSDVAEVMSMHPDAANRIRHAQVRCAALRGFLWAAHLKKQGLDWRQFTNCLASRKDINLKDHGHHPEVHALKALIRSKTLLATHVDKERSGEGAASPFSLELEGNEQSAAEEEQQSAVSRQELSQEIREELRQEFREQLQKLEARMPSKEDIQALTNALRLQKASLGPPVTAARTTSR